jgi:hypothetical protein
MNYNKIMIYCDKYNIKRYTDFGKPLTYNKLRHIINDHTNKKHKLSQNKRYTILLNSILKMILMIMISRKLCIIILETKIIIYYII